MRSQLAARRRSAHHAHHTLHHERVTRKRAQVRVIARRGGRLEVDRLRVLRRDYGGMEQHVISRRNDCCLPLRWRTRAPIVCCTTHTFTTGGAVASTTASGSPTEYDCVAGKVVQHGVARAVAYLIILISWLHPARSKPTLKRSMQESAFTRESGLAAIDREVVHRS